MEMIRVDCHVDRHGSMTNRGHRSYSRGCAQNELAIWVIAKMEKMPIDCHALLIIIPLSSGVSSSSSSIWQPPAVVTIVETTACRGDPPTIAGEVWGYSEAAAIHRNLENNECLWKHQYYQQWIQYKYTKLIKALFQLDDYFAPVQQQQNVGSPAAPQPPSPLVIAVTAAFVTAVPIALKLAF
ncbi:hypothetical protein Y032_0081g1419 [Ancylostoma ceylanicum]|uniref:Uncharacterized protein n=2 Tax=Ancylostoma ceylanicum TaxID=53326 RepID=A0A016TS10_9BILA|nr:hypothetical protein Y032_0081g1419 [Ancylostoma ceylanicum]